MFVYGDLTAWALIFIAIAMAYFVCLKASKEGSKLFKYGGYIIGLLILVLSLVLGVTNLVSRIRRQGLMQPRIGRTPARSVITPRVKTPVVPRKVVGITEKKQTIPQLPATVPQQAVPQQKRDIE